MLGHGAVASQGKPLGLLYRNQFITSPDANPMYLEGLAHLGSYIFADYKMYGESNVNAGKIHQINKSNGNLVTTFKPSTCHSTVRGLIADAGLLWRFETGTAPSVNVNSTYIRSFTFGAEGTRTLTYNFYPDSAQDIAKIPSDDFIVYMGVAGHKRIRTNGTQDTGAGSTGATGPVEFDLQEVAHDGVSNKYFTCDSNVNPRVVRVYNLNLGSVVGSVVDTTSARSFAVVPTSAVVLFTNDNKIVKRDYSNTLLATSAITNFSAYAKARVTAAGNIACYGVRSGVWGVLIIKASDLSELAWVPFADNVKDYAGYAFSLYDSAENVYYIVGELQSYAVKPLEIAAVSLGQF